jgi:hypothetical protein
VLEQVLAGRTQRQPAETTRPRLPTTTMHAPADSFTSAGTAPARVSSSGSRTSVAARSPRDQCGSNGGGEGPARSTPITQHSHVRVLILAYAVEFGVTANAANVLRLGRQRGRWAMLRPRYVIMTGAAAEGMGLLTAALDAVTNEDVVTILGSALLGVASIYLLVAVVLHRNAHA